MPSVVDNTNLIRRSKTHTFGQQQAAPPDEFLQVDLTGNLTQSQLSWNKLLPLLFHHHPKKNLTFDPSLQCLLFLCHPERQE